MYHMYKKLATRIQIHVPVHIWNSVVNEGRFRSVLFLLQIHVGQMQNAYSTSRVRVSAEFCTDKCDFIDGQSFNRLCRRLEGFLYFPSLTVCCNRMFYGLYLREVRSVVNLPVLGGNTFATSSTVRQNTWD